MVSINTAIPNVFRNIHSGTKCIKSSVINFSKSEQVETLSKEMKAILPDVAQVLIENSYMLNTRNPYLEKVLAEKGEALIGSNPLCNIQVPNFYNGIANHHLLLKKTPNGIVVENVSGTNAKVEVVPKSEIKPFATGVSDIKLAQGNIGDCFVLSQLYALSHSPKGQQYLEKMVSIDENANYVVSFCNSEPITIKPDELYGEKYKDGTSKTPVKGDLTIRAIERAYAKLIKHKNDRANFARLDEGGFPQEALYRMTGLSSTVYPIKNNAAPILQKIEQKGIENYILTCSTPTQGKYGKYMDSEGKFITSHAYAVKSINTDEGSIEIVNPHNTKMSEEISIQDFQNMFDFVYAARV